MLHHRAHGGGLRAIAAPAETGAVVCAHPGMLRHRGLHEIPRLAVVVPAGFQNHHRGAGTAALDVQLVIPHIEPAFYRSLAGLRGCSLGGRCCGRNAGLAGWWSLPGRRVDPVITAAAHQQEGDQHECAHPLQFAPAIAVQRGRGCLQEMHQVIHRMLVMVCISQGMLITCPAPPRIKSSPNASSNRAMVRSPVQCVGQTLSTPRERKLAMTL